MEEDFECWYEHQYHDVNETGHLEMPGTVVSLAPLAQSAEARAYPNFGPVSTEVGEASQVRVRIPPGARTPGRCAK